MIYKTREMWLAAALEVQGCFITSIETEGRMATFIIDMSDDTDMSSIEREYWDNRLTAPVFALKEKVKELRTRLNHLMEKV